ncbi:alpha/beta fold hydrolase [Paraferrimonas sp. SM1919]|uniref:alpha/beta fold hydrolase n=1 Tax=Paraferrimonas sp. SM1919 TaxID=2662263 RepID=UPI0013CF5B54|nr:alpha/beta fold hydrolase [Paraferrimonas sp. SM1919]
MTNTIVKGYLNNETEQLHLASCGDPSLPKLVLLHQVPSHLDMYQKLMPLLSEHFFVIAPDLPGLGQSQALSSQNIELMTVHLIKHIEAEFGKVDYLFGHHSGASVAAQWAANSKVKALVLSGPPWLTEKQRAGLVASVADNTPVADGTHLVNMWAKLSAKDPQADLSVVNRELLSAIACQGAYKQTYQAILDHDLGQCLNTISCPTLVFAGIHDPLLTGVKPSLFVLQQGCTISPPNTGGYICDTHPQWLSEQLIQFFQNK